MPGRARTHRALVLYLFTLLMRRVCCLFIVVVAAAVLVPGICSVQRSRYCVVVGSGQCWLRGQHNLHRRLLAVLTSLAMESVFIVEGVDIQLKRIPGAG